MLDKIGRACRMNWRTNKFSLKNKEITWKTKKKIRCNLICVIVTELTDILLRLLVDLCGSG